MIECERVHLYGAGMSGRAVSLRILNGAEHDEMTVKAIRDADLAHIEPDASIRGFHVESKHIDFALARCIQGVSEPGCKPLTVLEVAVAKATGDLTVERAKEQGDGNVVAALERRLKVATDALDAGRLKLEKLEPQKEADLSLPNALHKLFTSKDLIILAAWYRRNHRPTQEEIDTILGNAVRVSS